MKFPPASGGYLGNFARMLAACRREPHVRILNHRISPPRFIGRADHVVFAGPLARPKRTRVATGARFGLGNLRTNVAPIARPFFLATCFC